MNAIHTKLHETAAPLGLFIQYYNPGGGGTFKVLTADVDYFAASDSQTVYRSKSAQHVTAFLDGYEKGFTAAM